MKFNLRDIFLLFLIFALGVCAGGYYFKKEISPPEGIDFSTFFEAWQEIEDNFYNFSKENQEDMLYGAVQGVVNSLNDPYSDFLNPEETLEFQESLTGTYKGIGAEIGIRDGNLTIISPLKGTPAERANLLPGDKIVEINDESTEEITLSQAVTKIRGKEGTEVTLKIEREKEIFEVKIKREKIDIPILDFKIIEENIAYIQIYNFYEDAPLEFNKISEEILNSDIKKIILDLRNNPGGYLQSACDIGNFFIKKGETILKEDYGKGAIEDITSEGPGAFSSFKTVILINKGSASASEILAGAVKEQNQAILIGEKSFGKGTVQEFIPLKNMD